MAKELKQAYIEYRDARNNFPPGSEERQVALERVIELGGAKDFAAILKKREKPEAKKKDVEIKNNKKSRVQNTKSKQIKISKSKKMKKSSTKGKTKNGKK